MLVVTNEKNGDVVEYCRNQNIPFVSSSLKDDQTLNQLKNLQPTIAILASYGALIPESIINIFPNGIINIHPSLLPKWKGPSPIPFSLLNGDDVTGVTLIRLDDEIDHGPILLQKPYSLKGNETAEDLLSILFEIGADMVKEIVIKLENAEQLPETPQDHTHESWSYKIEKKDGMIDINNPPEKDKLNNMIRAYFPWPGVWLTTQLNNQKRIIKLLPDGKVHVEGKKPVNYGDFINGYNDEGKEILNKLKINY